MSSEIEQENAKLKSENRELKERVNRLWEALKALDRECTSSNICDDDGWAACTPYLNIPEEVTRLVEHAINTKGDAPEVENVR
jgi:hypothetical protein